MGGWRGGGAVGQFPLLLKVVLQSLLPIEEYVNTSTNSVKSAFPNLYFFKHIFCLSSISSYVCLIFVH